MIKSTFCLWCSVLCFLGSVAVFVGQSRPQTDLEGKIRQTYAIKNAKIVTVTGPTIPNGNILIQDGKITQIGANIAIPSNAKVIDAKGLTAYPGMIDPHTAMGLQEISSVQATQDASELGDVNPELRASAAINPQSEHVDITRANGITTVGSLPRGGLISGQGTVIDLDGWGVKDML